MADFFYVLAVVMAVAVAAFAPIAWLLGQLATKEPPNVSAWLQRMSAVAVPQRRMVPAFTIAMAAASPIAMPGAATMADAQFSFRTIQTTSQSVFKGSAGLTSTAS